MAPHLRPFLLEARSVAFDPTTPSTSPKAQPCLLCAETLECDLFVTRFESVDFELEGRIELVAFVRVL